MRPFDPIAFPLEGQRLIEASAGTGKTYSIALLFLRLLIERQLEVDEILVVTFTKSATEELRSRIRARIRDMVDLLAGNPVAGDADPLLTAVAEKLTDPAAARQRLQDVLVRFDEACIATIHGFCQRMLRDHAFESGLPFSVEMLESEEDLRAQIMEDFWRRHFYQAGPREAAWVMSQWAGPQKLGGVIGQLMAKPEARLLPQVDIRRLEEIGKLGDSLWPEIRTLWREHHGEVMAILQDNPCLGRDKKKSYHLERLPALQEEMDRLTGSKETPWELPAGVELFAASVMAVNLKGKKIAPRHTFFDRFDEFHQARVELVKLSRVQILTEAQRYLVTELERRKRRQEQMYFNDMLTLLDRALTGESGRRLQHHIRSTFRVALVDEFQDTDPVQYRIFHSLFGQEPEPNLFMIGDPKQSIYSFRGADIFAYLQAGSDTPADASFTMTTNYRSATPMVEAVNVLFDRPESFLFTGQLDYHPVEPGPRADEAPFRIAGEEACPLQLRFLTAEEHATPGQKVIAKDRGRQAAAAWVAGEIAHLLARGCKQKAVIGDRGVRGGDLAVLVRTHMQAALVQDELRRLDISSVYYSQHSVFESAEAGQIYHVLAAVLDQADEGRVCRALVGDLFGLDALGLDALRNDRVAWDGLLAELTEYRRLWFANGIMAMMHGLLRGRQVVSRLAGTGLGERKLTNILHLVELLQEEEARHNGDDLLLWLGEQLQRPAKTTASQQLRLESDEELVKIVTVHKAKGLEYPVVFLPFLWDVRRVDPNQPFFYHGEEDGKMFQAADLGSGDDGSFGEAERERLAEDLRLLYVALTRARHCCYIAWGRLSGMEHSALAWLLHRDSQGAVEPGQLDEERIKQDIAGLNIDGKLLNFLDDTAGGAAGPMPLADDDSLVVRPFTSNIDTSWTVTSYSRLLASQAHSEEEKAAGNAVSPVEPAAAEPGPFSFPKGPVAGNCLHAIFEQLDLAGFTEQELELLASEQLQRSSIRQEWLPGLVRWIQRVVATPLLPGSSLCLAQLAEKDRRAEMSFYFSLRDVDLQQLDSVLAEHGLPPARFQGKPLQGLMRGYIDLVFRSDNRYFIADYKSNYLGPAPDDYAEAQLQDAMLEHRYDLQYLIYAVALHRYLGMRLRGYEYEQHFGGVFYLFLRGMDPGTGPARGVWHDKPSSGLVNALDNCFGQEGGMR